MSKKLSLYIFPLLYSSARTSFVVGCYNWGEVLKYYSFVGDESNQLNCLSLQSHLLAMAESYPPPPLLLLPPSPSPFSPLLEGPHVWLPWPSPLGPLLVLQPLLPSLVPPTQLERPAPVERRQYPWKPWRPWEEQQDDLKQSLQVTKGNRS